MRDATGRAELDFISQLLHSISPPNGQGLCRDICGRIRKTGFLVRAFWDRCEASVRGELAKFDGNMNRDYEKAI